nr:PREDICTED: coiled-coil domain-containing protein 38 isoform X1 [Lepisosteus oculatus]
MAARSALPKTASWKVPHVNTVHIDDPRIKQPLSFQRLNLPRKNALTGEDDMTSSNPFVIPLNLDIFTLSEQTLKKQEQERRIWRHLPVDLKSTYLSRIRARSAAVQSAAAEFVNANEKREKPPVHATWATVITRGRHREKESRRDYMEKQREMFLVQYALSVKKDAMKRMEEDSAKEEQRLRLAEKQLEEDAIAFDRFIKENDQNSVEAVKIAENETMIKMEKTSKIKKATAKMMTIKSDISKNEEILSEYLLYKKFLTDVAPPEWRAEQVRKRELRRLARKKEEGKTRSKKVFFQPSPPKGEGKPPPAFSRRESKVGKVLTQRRLSRTLEKSTKPALDNLTDTKESVKEDICDDDEEAEIYFTDPKQMLHILSELEEQNLSYIQNFQETEEAMDEIRKRVKLTQDKMEHETNILTQQIEMLKAAIQREEEKTSELELKSRIFSFGEFNAEKQDRMLSLLNKQVNEVYQTCIGDVGANISTLQMLTNIENKMEEVIECLETLPREKVEVVEANREKEMRIRLREEKLLLKKKHQEERLRLAVERANADTRKRTGRKLMMRSEPPAVIKKDKRPVTSSKEHDEMLYFFK